MKKQAIILSLIISIFLINSIAATEFPSYSNKYVNDFAGILDSNSSSTLRNSLSNIERDTTAQIVFVSMTTINGAEITQYATELGQYWGVGQSDKDNGIVILYVKDINRISAVVGYGLEGILPDSKVGRLLDENYVPLRDNNQTVQGIIKFTEALTQVIEDNKDEVISGKAGGNSNNSYILWIIVSIIIFMIVLGLINRTRYIYKSQDKLKKKGSKKSAIWAIIAQIILFIVIFIAANIIVTIIAIILLIILSRFTGIRGSPFYVGNSGGLGGSGFSGGGGFGGGGFGGGGASR